MRLTNEQVEQYFDDGFLLVEDVFTRDELQPVLDWFEEIVDIWADKLHRAGRVMETFKGEDVYTRLASLEKAWPGAGALITQRNSMGTALANLWSSDKLLDMAEQFIGPDIYGHPISIFRSKTPDTALMTVPWHQDSGYFMEGGEGTLQPTAWIPFIDTDLENGTLQFVRGSHKFETVFPHRLEHEIGHPESWYLYIAEEDMPPGERVRVDVPMGAVLWHQNMLVHRSTENHSDQVQVDVRSPLPAARAADRVSRHDEPRAHPQVGRSGLPPRLGVVDLAGAGGQPELPAPHRGQLRVLVARLAVARSLAEVLGGGRLK